MFGGEGYKGRASAKIALCPIREVFGESCRAVDSEDSSLYLFGAGEDFCISESGEVVVYLMLPSTK